MIPYQPEVLVLGDETYDTNQHRNWKVSVTLQGDSGERSNQPAEDIILELPGTGHMMEDWIRDHPVVDFIVDYGSSVSAVSETATADYSRLEWHQLEN